MKSVTLNEHSAMLNGFVVGLNVRQFLHGSGFANLLKLANHQFFYCKPLISVLVDCYDTKTFTFRLGDSSCELYFGLRDILYITGLRIVGKPEVTIEARGEDIAKILFPYIEGVYEKKGFVLKKLKELAMSDQPFVIRVRATVLLLLGTLVFPNSSSKHVKGLYGNFLINLDEINDYAWGEACLVEIHQSLQENIVWMPYSSTMPCYFKYQMHRELAVVPFFCIENHMYHLPYNGKVQLHIDENVSRDMKILYQTRVKSSYRKFVRAPAPRGNGRKDYFKIWRQRLGNDVFDQRMQINDQKWIRVDDEDVMENNVSVFKRKYSDEFLEFCFERFHVAIWSSRKWENLDPILQNLFPSARDRFICRYSQEQCCKVNQVFCKDLTRIWVDLRAMKYGKFDESNTLLADDSIEKSVRNLVELKRLAIEQNLKDSERRFETMVKEARMRRNVRGINCWRSLENKYEEIEKEGITIHTLEESISDIDDVDVKNLREGICYEYVKEEVEKIFQMRSSAAVGSFAKAVLYDVVLDSGFGGERGSEGKEDVHNELLDS
ncbi:OLC1v1030514C1 [Oldenlandia corymbosa var. corymbosa]|uniref:Mitochondrial import inner membrane translocase subunit TIM50 n=1 Tax=Oldenlandia corymbosa var. corymbosa TaxID=529605 RepID=A0AAV1CJU6_OLDCO|nr:OLC1v1030514C1 [Oldenlandia corymbosa var. corymbosa]